MPTSANPIITRIALIDLARGVALIAMAIFHFNYDLELFQIEKRGYISQPHWVYFARSIAASFLILVGFSLALSHINSIRWPAFWIRQAKVAGAALIITIATYFATPDVFIFFGILHQIAFASLAGLIFLRLHWSVVGASALFFLLARDGLRSELLDAPIWWWTGLSQHIPRSSDYVPVFPWFGWVLVGITLAKVFAVTGWLPKLADLNFEKSPSLGALAQFLQLLGRYSLIFYLAHQPIMVGAIYVYLQIAS